MAPSDAHREPAPVRAAEQSTDGRREQWSGDLDRSWIMTVELVAATFTWGGIGWLADRLIGTEPWLMLVGFVLGNATGIYLVWLRSNTEEEAEQTRRRASEGPDTTPTDAQVDSRSIPELRDGTGTDAPRP